MPRFNTFKIQIIVKTRWKIPTRTQHPSFTSACTGHGQLWTWPTLSKPTLAKFSQPKKPPEPWRPETHTQTYTPRDLKHHTPMQTYLHPKDLNSPSGPQNPGPHPWTPEGPVPEPPPPDPPSAGPPKISIFFLCLVSQQFSFLSSLFWRSSHWILVVFWRPGTLDMSTFGLGLSFSVQHDALDHTCPGSTMCVFCCQSNLFSPRCASSTFAVQPSRGGFQFLKFAVVPRRSWSAKCQHVLQSNLLGKLGTTRTSMPFNNGLETLSSEDLPATHLARPTGRPTGSILLWTCCQHKGGAHPSGNTTILLQKA